MYNAEDIGKRLTDLRKIIGKTQEEVAEDLNVSKYTISKIENGKTGMSIDFMIVVSKYYNTTIDYLLFGGNNRYNFIYMINKLDDDKKRIIICVITSVIDALNKS